MGLDYLTGTWDWNVGLEYCLLKYACHARQRPIANVVLSCSSSSPSPCSQTNSPVESPTEPEVVRSHKILFAGNVWTWIIYGFDNAASPL